MDMLVLDEWMEAAATLSDPLQRLAFWDALSNYARLGQQPEPSDGIGVMALAMAKRMIDQHRARSEAGRYGGIKSGAKRRTAKQARSNGEANESTREADAKQTRSNGEANGRTREANANKIDRMNEGTSTARARGRMPDLDLVLTDCETWGALDGMPLDQFKAFVTEAYNELAASGWMDANGHAVKNWRAYLRRVVSEKKICAARAARDTWAPVPEEG